MESCDCQVNDGIIIGELPLGGDGAFDFALDFLNQLSCLALHWFGYDRSLEFPDA